MTIYFVDTNHASALDTNAGTTEALPWKTMQKAASTLVAGDTVNIKQGTYTGAVNPANSGTASARITYRAFPGHERQAVLGGNGGFNIISKSYITLSGLRVQNQTTTNTIHIQGPCSNVTISGCRTFNTIGSGISCYGAAYNVSVWDSTSPGSLVTALLIENNQIELANNGGYNENITLAYGIDGFEIRDNELFTSATGDHDLGGEGIDVKQGVRNGKIHHNHVHDLKRIGIYVDAANWYATNIEIYNNLCRQAAFANTTAGIIVAKERAGSTIDGVKVYNNVCSGWGRDGISVYKHTGDDGLNFRNVTVINNTTYNNGGEAGHGGGGIAMTYPNTGAQNWICRNNIAFGNIDFQISFSPAGTGHVSSNNLTTNPQWVNAAGGDFHLQSTSPAINTGTSIGAPAFDFDGITRPQGSGFDVGAFEFATVTPTTYKLKRSLTSGGPYTTITPVDFSATSYIDTNAVNGTTYRYVVTANNQNGESVNSNEVSLTPSAPSTPGAPTITGAAGNGQITLSWGAVTTADDYRAKRGSQTGGPYSVVGTILAPTTSFNHTGLTNGQTGHYVVSARNAAGEGPNSNQVSLTPQATTMQGPLKIYILSGKPEFNWPDFDQIHPQLYRAGTTTRAKKLKLVLQAYLGIPTNSQDPNYQFNGPEIKSKIFGLYERSYSGFISIDVERWYPYPADIEKFVKIINWFKEAYPSATVGEYGPPLWGPGYMQGAAESAYANNTTAYRNWHEKNLSLQPMTDIVQALFGSHYVRTTDEAVWKSAARGYISESFERIPRANTLDSYLYINGKYQTGVTPASLKFQDLPLGVFRRCLETFSTTHFSNRRLPGVVIWSDIKPWSEIRTKNWWTDTWKFLGFTSNPA